MRKICQIQSILAQSLCHYITRKNELEDAITSSIKSKEIVSDTDHSCHIQQEITKSYNDYPLGILYPTHPSLTHSLSKSTTMFSYRGGGGGEGRHEEAEAGWR